MQDKLKEIFEQSDKISLQDLAKKLKVSTGIALELALSYGATLLQDELTTTPGLTDSFSDLKVKLSRLENQVRKEKATVKELTQTVQTKDDQLDVLTQLSSTPVVPTNFATPKKEKKTGNINRTAVIVASDWHVGERVDPATVNGLNEYSPDIARERAIHFWHNAVTLINESPYVNKLVIALLGDFISGTIHPELLENNYLSPMEEILFAQELLLDGLQYVVNNTSISPSDIQIPTSSGNHCISEDTEVLTDIGWVKASEVNKDTNIASFSQISNVISYNPIEAITKFTDDKAYFVSSKHCKELVNRNHKLYYQGNLTPVQEVIKYSSLKNKDFVHSLNKINDFDYYQDDYELDRLRLITWIVCDGTLVDRSKYGEGKACRVQFKLSKERKITELKKLLDRMGMDYTFKPATMSGGNVLQPYYIRIYAPAFDIYHNWLNKRKNFPSYFRNLESEEIKAVVDTISITDGTDRGNHIEWSSVEFCDIDVIQHACVVNNIPFRWVGNEKPNGFKQSKRKTLWTAHFYPNGLSEASLNHKVTIDELDLETNFVGITTKDGTLVTRYKGVVNFTGNSRSTFKTHMSTHSVNSYEWMMYQNMASKLPDFDWKVELGYFTYLDILKLKFRFSHFDRVRYGGGVNGVGVPLNKYVARINQTQHADYDIGGHFHTAEFHTQFAINGSLIGPSSYSITSGFPATVPEQIMLVVDERVGIHSFTKIPVTSRL